jgi:hypothetical protein
MRVDPVVALEQPAHRFDLVLYAGIWVCKRVLIVCFASIQAGEILLNQESK